MSGEDLCGEEGVHPSFLLGVNCAAFFEEDAGVPFGAFGRGGGGGLWGEVEEVGLVGEEGC